MESSIKECSVPGCLLKHKARGVCDYHYHVWRNLGSGFEEVAPFVKHIPTPMRSCSCPREGDNLIVERDRGGYRRHCRRCVNEARRRRYSSEKRRVRYLREKEKVSRCK